MYQKKENFLQKNEPSSCHIYMLMLRWLIHVGIIWGEIICKSSNWQHIQRLITILGANWQLFRLERIAYIYVHEYFILSTQNITFYWFVMKKKCLLPIWWYNRGLFPLGNKCFWVFVLNGEICWDFFFFFFGQTSLRLKGKFSSGTKF